MSSRITRDDVRLEATAASLGNLGDRVSEIGRHLDSAVRAARRGDVPELGEIEGVYGGLRSRISNSGITLDIQARDLRAYVRTSRMVEALNMSMLTGIPPWAIAGAALGAGHPGKTRFGLWSFSKSLAEIAAGEGADKLAELAGHDIFAGGAPLWKQIAAAHGLAIGKPLSRFLLVYGLYSSFKDFVWGKDEVEKFTGGIGLTFGSLSFAEAAGVAFESKWLLAAGDLALPVTVGVVGGDAIGRYRYQQIAMMEAQGIDPVKVAEGDLTRAQLEALKHGGLPGPGTLQVAHASYDLVTAELATNKWIGKHVFGAVDEGPNDYLGNHQAAVIHAGLQQQFPGASIVQQDDGKFVIRVPNPNGMPAYSMTFDNKTGKLVRQ
jgi:hypothetical protein